ncbi:MAG: RDD family protein [Gammaproteobacteria bacterium]|nr:RDD family protein [Gammaproteobacteria bacterium]
MSKDHESNWIAGFWERIGAFVIDVLILGVLGLSLGLFLGDVFAGMGNRGVMVGFSISLVYFGVMNSQVSNGQTLGKKIVGIRVVDVNNQSIGLARSIARYCVLGVPYFFGGVQFGNSDIAHYLNLAVNLIAIAGSLSIAYLYIFNRVTRQSLHDLIVRTYVVKTAEDKQPIGPISTAHYGAVGLIFFFSTLMFVPTNDDAQAELIADLIAASDLLVENPIVISADVFDGKSMRIFDDTGATEMSYVTARIFLAQDQISNAVIARELATTLVFAYRPSLERDVIQVTLTYGYNIGIASRWNNHAHLFKPSEFIDPG